MADKREPALDAEQNARFRAFAKQLRDSGDDDYDTWEKVAQAIGMTGGQLSKIINGESGTSQRFLLRAAELCGVSRRDALFGTAADDRRDITRRWKDTAGYRDALREARKFARYPEAIWTAVGEISFPGMPERVSWRDLVRSADMIAQSYDPVSENVRVR